MKDFKPCILPWINFSTNPNGRPRACGYSDIATVKKTRTTLRNSTVAVEWNNDYFKSIRKEFLEGQWPENCKRCKYVEELNGRSKRIDENEAYYEQNKHLFEKTSADGTLSELPKHIDVRTGTTCNQKCIHCGTGVSSKWREDKLLFDKYPNTESVNINDRWIDNETKFWDYLRSNMQHFKRYNFLGGESFANKRHNEYLKELSESAYAAEVELQYVTNGTLLTLERLEQLDKFRLVKLRLSVDAIGTAGEYFRFPMDWKEFIQKVELVNEFIVGKKHFDVGFQWTCSNISMFYLDQTYKLLTDNFPNLRFIFSNHVEFPLHMSAQNLPAAIKQQILKKLKNIELAHSNISDLEFYINHMMEKELWPDYHKILLHYLDDLDKARNCDWRKSFSEMKLHRYDPDIWYNKLLRRGKR